MTAVEEIKKQALALGVKERVQLAESLLSSLPPVAETVVAEAPTVKPRRENGRLRGAKLVLRRENVAAAVRAERDAR
ncbi:MAG: hypothetical protein EXS35_12350 [Pedosphaera sp.]|nr:hypothetical protein [Pedosphaera sp.]